MSIADIASAESALADELAVSAGLLQRSNVHVRTQGNGGAGSGVIWEPDGLIITNAHVARGPAVNVELWDGRSFDGEVRLRDAQRDLAAVKIDASGLPAATVADSDDLRVGQLVTAVGNPLGMTGALTLGIIHAIAPAQGHGSRTWVQADLRLLPGNSGGPLADASGRVIGINAMVAGGLGLAVPSNAVREFLGQPAERPHLGVTLQPVVVPGRDGLVNGVLILDVASNSPAERAGLMLGDTIAGIAGRKFGSLPQFLSILHALGPVPIRLEILRGGTLFPVDVMPLLPPASQEAA